MAPVVSEWLNLSRSIVYCLPFHFVGSIVLDKIAVWRMLWRHWIYDNFSLLSEELFGIYHLCEGELMALHSWHACMSSEPSIMQWKFEIFFPKKVGGGNI